MSGSDTLQATLLFRSVVAMEHVESFRSSLVVCASWYFTEHVSGLLKGGHVWMA